LPFGFVSAQLQGYSNLRLRRSLAQSQKSSLRKATEFLEKLQPQMGTNETQMGKGLRYARRRTVKTTCPRSGGLFSQKIRNDRLPPPERCNHVTM